jgi:ubiquinone/menaquinone biosynthesis C-methylase UbiE
MLKNGQTHHPGLNLLQGDCTRLPLTSGSQDAILMECALSLSGGSAEALEEFKRVLTPHGKLVVTDLYIREVLDPQGLICLSASPCLRGARTEAAIRRQVAESGFTITAWQDQTPAFKQWLARMVFKLGSLEAFYRQLVTSEKDAQSLISRLGSQIKLGYYSMVAQKAGI